MQNPMDPFDELAAMFLTAPQPLAPAQSPGSPTVSSPVMASSPRVAPSVAARTTPMNQPSHTSTTELLIVGHMPVRAGLWLVPYADAMARQIGTVGLLRLDGDEPTLQLLRGSEALGTAPLRLPLAQTIYDLAGCIDLWMLRATESLSAEDAISAAADRITILSSADEAAMVAAYQTIKDLAQAAEKTGLPLPRIGLAIAGADEQAAEVVIDRLNRTSVSFLGVEVKLVTVLPRIDAGIRCTRYVTFGSESRPNLLDVRQWLEQAKAMPIAPAMRPQEAPHTSVSAREVPLREIARPAARQPDVIGRIEASPETFVHDARRILRQPSADSPTSSPSAAVAPNNASPSVPPPAVPISPAGHSNILENVGMSYASGAPSSAAAASHDVAAAVRLGSAADDLASFIAPHAVKLPPKVVIEVEHKRPGGEGATIEPDDRGQAMPLARFVAGLSPLPIRAPGHERIEIAVDADGLLHLLARESSLRELPVVDRWAHAHRELIAMACPQHRIDPAGRARCHIFASEPISVADLHASNLRLHVLAPVSVGDKTVWYAAPLNVVT